MNKRAIWVIETLDNGQWQPMKTQAFPKRQHAWNEMRCWRENYPESTFCTVKYVPEDDK